MATTLTIDARDFVIGTWQSDDDKGCIVALVDANDKPTTDFDEAVHIILYSTARHDFMTLPVADIPSICRWDRVC